MSRIAVHGAEMEVNTSKIGTPFRFRREYEMKTCATKALFQNRDKWMYHIVLLFDPTTRLP